MTNKAPDFSDSFTTSGKYFRVEVPNFASAIPTATSRDAYLRIGSMKGFEDTARGKELWDEFTGFAADGGIKWHKRNVDGEGVERSVRYDPQGQLAALVGLEGTAALELRRKVLLEETAWRDHCDGNRVSTTSGDKVEIVGGNYQLVVLGRAPNADGSSMDDHSGGNHIDGTVSPPQTMASIRYRSSFEGGSWSMVEESRKASVHEIFTGELREDFCGPRHTSIVGVLNATVLTELAAQGVGGGGLRGDAAFTPVAMSGDDALIATESDVNPDVLSVTLASKIVEYTGAAAARVGSIVSKTYAITVDESADVTSLTETLSVALDHTSKATILGSASDTTTVGASLTESTTVGGVLTESTTVVGAYTESLTAGSITEAVSTGSLTSSESYSVRNETVTGGASFSMEHIGSRMALETIGADLYLKAIGTEATLQVGVHDEIFMGAHKEITIGSRHEIVLGWEYENNVAFDRTALKTWEKALAIFLG